jgi:O-antigen/teichoic acid export membrane protein
MLSMLLVGREIGPQAMGLATIALAAFLLLDVLAASVFTDALVQHPRLGPNHAGSAATAGALVGAVAAAALVAVSPLLAAVSDAPDVAALTCALAPLLPLSAWSGAMAGVALRQHRFGLLAARALLGQPVALGAGLLAAAEGFGPWAMIANQAAATLVTFVLLLLLARQGARPRLDVAALRELWPVAGPQIAAVFVTFGKYRLFLLALGFTTGHSVVALSHAAFRLLDGALMVVYQTIPRIGLPRLCAERADRARLADAFGELAQVQAFLGLPVTVGTALVAPAMVHTLLGPEWQAAGNAAQVVVSLVVPLALLLALRPSTPAAVAVCWASQSILLPPITAWLALRELGRSPWWLLKKVAPALLATGCMAAVVVALQTFVPMRPGVELIASVACGGAAYVAAAAALLRLRLPPALTSRIMVAAE